MSFHPPWDTEIDTPATIAVIGGGPCGVETALYARFLGYSVELFDQRKVGDSIFNWGDRWMPATWRELASSLGLAALEAHEHRLPDPDQVPTCREYVQEYLLPLARCDLLYSSVNVRAKVISISRLGCDSGDNIPDEQRAEQEFRLLVSSEQRGEYSQVVDLVLDCSGGQSVRRGLATGGGLPIGWSNLATKIHVGRYDIRGRDRDKFAGKRVLLFGNDHTAAANAVELDELQASGTKLFWVTPKRIQPLGKLLDLRDDTSPVGSDEIAQAVQIYQNADSDSVVSLAAWGIEAIAVREDQMVVTLQSTEEETLDVLVDRIVHCGPCLPEPSYQHSLRLDAKPSDPVVQSEPHFYILGDRSSTVTSPEHGYQSCQFSNFREQIRRVFGMVGGRSELDLYSTVKPTGQSTEQL